MAEIVLDRVSKRFAAGADAVRDVSLTIADGEFFILVGPSGCGKSTLLQLIVGLEEPSEGEVRVDGRVVNGVDPKDRNMAMVFQTYALYPHLTVFENLAFPLRLARRPEDEIRRRVAKAAETLQLAELLDRRPAQLSGGQRQRAAMGRAIVREPCAFLMDEPLSNLDAKLRMQMRTEISRLQKRLSVTTIYVTHDQTEAMTLGDRIAVLRGGTVQQVGTPRELYESPANLFVAGFIGSPAMNFLPAIVENGRLAIAGVEIGDAPRGGGSGRLVAGIRPEHLAVASGDGEMLRGTVEVVEWTGSEAYAHLELGGVEPGGLPELEDALGSPNGGRSGAARVIARVDPASEVEAGQDVGLRIDSARVHLFDAANGARVR